MRRPGIIFFIAVIIFMFVSGKEEISVNGATVKRTGVIRQVEEKSRYIHYYIDDSLLAEKKGKNRVYRQGDEVSFKGVERNMKNMSIDGFNYGRYLKSRGIRHYIEGSIIKKTGGRAYLHCIGRLREKIRDMNRYMYKENSDFLNAAVLGIKTGLSKDTRDMFTDTGTSHILAVSGLHISILISMMAVIVSRVNNLYRFTAACLILIFYTDLSGNSISVKRAAVFSIAGFLGFFLYRRGDMINLVFIMSALFILENRYIVYNPSFLLSFLAVLSITVFNKYIKKKVYFSFISVTLSSQILTLPVIILFFREFSTVSVAGNLVAVTPLPFILMMDIVSLLLYGISLNLSLYAAGINSRLIDAVFGMLDRISGFSSGNITVRDADVSFVAVYYVIITALVLFLEYRSIKNSAFDPDSEKTYKNSVSGKQS